MGRKFNGGCSRATLCKPTILAWLGRRLPLHVSNVLFYLLPDATTAEKSRRSFLRNVKGCCLKTERDCLRYFSLFLHLVVLLLQRLKRETSLSILFSRTIIWIQLMFARFIFIGLNYWSEFSMDASSPWNINSHINIYFASIGNLQVWFFFSFYSDLSEENNKYLNAINCNRIFARDFTSLILSQFIRSNWRLWFYTLNIITRNMN